MKRKRRTRILIKSEADLAAEICAEVREVSVVQVLQEPQEGLVMIKMREQAKNSLFFLGELLVTEAKARVNGVLGLGIVEGHREKLAAELSVIDAAFNAGLPQTARWTTMLLEAEKINLEREREEQSRILRTKVHFTNMQEEDYMG